MIKIGGLIITNDKGEILLMKRDNKNTIPFPDTWDIFGGHVEEGETPEEGMKREIREELEWNVTSYSFFRKYSCYTGDVHINTKYIYTSVLDRPLETLTLHEGQTMKFIAPAEIPDLPFANIVKNIVVDYLTKDET
jgi:8-oxo-dGTP diphosphatase